MTIKRFKFGRSIITNSVCLEYEYSDINILNKYLEIEKNDNIIFKLKLNADDAFYGLGENNRGINKRGFRYISFNTDDPVITENRQSLYASHNFLIYSSKNNTIGNTIGIFIDTPKEVSYDLGFDDIDEAYISLEDGFDLYLIEGKDELDIIKGFRFLIGKSYIPPFWSFGVAQSRWGYKSKEDLEEVMKGFKDKNIPLDMLFIDIDCLDNFKDFTFNSSFYKNGKPNLEFFNECKNKGIHLIPIVDAAVKKEDGYFLYDELIKNKATTTDKDGKPFIVGVWPDDSVLPDFFNKDGQRIFGEAYKYYLDLGIDGFWNDMNEPALFYGKDNLISFGKRIKELDLDKLGARDYEIIKQGVYSMPNNMNDYHNFYHHYNLEYPSGTLFNHYDLHNMYGYMMVKSGSLYFDKYNKEHNLKKKYLLFSRSSMIGSHRYSGIWTGDNAAYWQHLLLNLKMLPSLNMCGYLYSGADIGGFGHISSEDLLLRWMALGIFIPLFRNHTCNWVKPKDYHLMKKTNIIRNILSIRYALLPYLYSEFIKSVNNNNLLFTPLSFIYKEDERTKEIEDELLFGDRIIIAPVYEQNRTGRMVYLPIDTIEIRMKSANEYSLKELSKGDHFIKVNLDEVVFFLIKDKALPIANIKSIDDIHNINDVNYHDLLIINKQGDKYSMYYEENNEIKEEIIEC